MAGKTTGSAHALNVPGVMEPFPEQVPVPDARPREIQPVEAPRAMGWLRDLPDFRDYTIDSTAISPEKKKLDQRPIKEQMAKLGVLRATAPKLPAAVDLRQWCSDIEDQKTIGSCTAHAAVGIMEYFERRAFGHHVDASRLFLYKVTRDLLNLSGDTGAYVRTTMGAMTLFGVPPERFWPYNIGDFDKEPTAFCYAFAQQYQAMSYYRLDPPNTAAATLLATIKTNLAAGLPAMFGFTVYSSYTQARQSGKIPFPVAGDQVVGGHAIAAVGYDDAMAIKNTGTGSRETVGALLIRNSWGTSWGAAGYGWLPYEYVLKALAVDWWSLTKCEWVESGQFGL